MLNRTAVDRVKHVNRTAQSCFGVAMMAFAGSLAAATLNTTLAGWMAVAGMASLGLFYLALGILNLGTSDSTAPARVPDVLSNNCASSVDPAIQQTIK